MPRGTAVLDRGTVRIIGKANIDNRLNAAELRKEIHKSGVCYLAIQMARSGQRPVLDEKTGDILMETLSEAAHIDLIKFLTGKVLPNAKEIPTADERASIDKWSNVIEADGAD